MKGHFIFAVVSCMNSGTCQEFLTDKYSIHCHNYIINILVFFLNIVTYFVFNILNLWSFMCFWFHIISPCLSFYTVLLFIRQVFYCCLCCLYKFFSILLYVMFCHKSIIFFQSQAVGLVMYALFFPVTISPIYFYLQYAGGALGQCNSIVLELSW